MTTDDQKKANKENSAKSTGPKSLAGKAASAKNAISHGLTTAPDADLVREYYRAYIEDSTAEPDLNSVDPFSKAAHALAHAEAVLARIQQAEERHLRFILSCISKQGQQSVMELDTSDFDDIDFLKILIKNGAEETESLRYFLKLSPQLPANFLKRELLLRRYGREAELKRRRAFDVWKHERQLGSI